MLRLRHLIIIACATLGEAFRIQSLNTALHVARPLSATVTAIPEDTTVPINWRRVWYPVIFSNFADRAKPFKFTLLEEPLVLWWDKEQAKFHAMADECPHRLAPLSEGMIEKDGSIQCPYHGWCFDGSSGKCTLVPQWDRAGGGDTSFKGEDGAARLPARTSGRAYPCVEKGGMIWVWPEINSEPDVGLICVPEPHSGALDYFRDLPVDYMASQENTVDVSHPPFAHHKTLSRRSKAEPMLMELDAPLSVNGFSGHQEGLPAGEAMLTTFAAPLFTTHTLRFNPLDLQLAIRVVPSSPGYCRVLNRAIPAPHEGPLGALLGALVRASVALTPHWMSHISASAAEAVEEDLVILAGQEKLAARKTTGKPPRYFMPTRSDLLNVNLLKWMDKYGGGEPFARSAVVEANQRKSLTREQLVDRYEQHTKHCACCSGALTNIRKTRPFAATAGVVGAAVASSMGVLAAAAGMSPAGDMGAAAVAAAAAAAGTPALAAALVALAVYVQLGQWEEKLTKGASHFQRDNV